MSEDHLSHLQFDLALVAAASTDAENHLQACARCKEELARLQTAQDRFAASEKPAQSARLIFPRLQPDHAPTVLSLSKDRPEPVEGLSMAPSTPLRFAQDERGGAAPVRQCRVPFWWLMPFAAAAAIALAMLVPRDRVRQKGAPSIEVFVKRGETLRWNGQALAEGDSVQLGYNASAARELTVFSIAPDCSAKIEWQGAAAADGLVPLSWRLTGEKREERLYVAFSESAVSLSDFSAALQKSGACTNGEAPALQSENFSAVGVALKGKP